MASITPHTAGETSRQGLRRMKRLAASASIVNGIPRAIVHPTTGLIIYPGGSAAPGHFIAPLDGSSPPRQLPTPPLLGLSSHITTSPEGRWVVLFHPNSPPPSQAGPVVQGDTGGTLAIYSQQVLLPFASSANTIPHSTLPLPTTPLAILPLYPARAHLANTRATTGLDAESKAVGSPTRTAYAAPAGPRPPPSHDPARGPVLLVLVQDGILLIHPQQTQNGEWGMNVLKCPLHTRTRVRTGDSIPVGAGLAGDARRGWMGVVEGSEGVWAALDKGEGRVDVVRVDVGTEDRGRWVLGATPLPRGPEIPRSEGMKTHLQGLVFVKLTDELRGNPKDEDGDTNIAEPAAERVAAALISQEYAEDDTARARIDVFGFERRQVQLSEAFAELSGQNDEPASWDWFTLPNALHTSTAPTGTTLLACIPSASTSADAAPTVALLLTPGGTVLSRLSLTRRIQANEDHWNALHGPVVDLGDLDVDGIVLSPAAVRGGLGFVGVHGADGIKLVLAPTDPGAEASADAPTTSQAALSQAASDIVLAVKSGATFADVVHAVFAQANADQLPNLPTDLIARTFELLKEEKGLDRMMRVRQVQIACFGHHDGLRRTLAAEMLRLQEASAIFAASVVVKDGTISFDLDQVWRLVYVVDWVFGVLARIFKESVSERGRIDWGISRPVSLDMIYLLNPIPRKLVLTLLAQLNAFTAFMSALNRPILPPEPSRPGQPISLSRDVGATVLAKDRIAGLGSKTGVDLVKWAKAIVEIHRGAAVPTDEDVQAYLRLEIRQQAEEVRKVLDDLPEPSALFVADPRTAEVFDAVTLQPLPKPVGAKCGRCEWRTLVVVSQLSRAMKEQGGLDEWREERKVVCGCGGAWGR